VGDLNVESALKMIEQLGLKVKVNETGRNIGRKLYFLTATGEVYLKPVCTYDPKPCRVSKRKKK
jgi:chemotaxis receptor (MCP) glutamine deamidase CheD